MITVIRRKAKSRLVRVILLIVVFSMTIGGSLFVPGLLRQITQTTNSLITVNGRPISAVHFAVRAQHEYERVESFRGQFGEQADMFLRMLGLGDPQQMAYEALVQEALVDNVARKIGLPLDETFVSHQLQNPSTVLQVLTDIVPMYVLDRDGSINGAALRRYLQYAHMSIADFEQLVEDALRRSTVLNLLETIAYVSPREIRERFVEQYLPRNFVVITFTFDRYLKNAKKLTPTQDELKSFFEQENKTGKRYWTPEMRTGIVWEFSPEGFSTTVSAADIENYYKKHRNDNYVQSAPKVKLRRILLRVENDAQAHDVHKKMVQLKEELDRNPSLFAQYAQEHSQDAKTAAQGGLLPWYTKEELKPVIGAAAFRLSKDGEISQILRSDEGYELIERVERQAKEYKSLDSVKNDIEKTLKNQSFADSFKKLLKQKLSRQAIPLDVMNEIKKTYKAQEIVLKNVALDESRIKRELFKLKKNEATHYTEDGKGFVLLLQDVDVAHAPTFESVKNRVQEDWYQHKARTMLDEDLNKAETLAATKSMEEVAVEYHASLEHLNGISSEDKKSSEQWTKKGYPVADFLGMQQPHEVKAFTKNTEGFLAKCVSQAAFDETLFNDKKEAITRELYQETRERLKRGFVASLQRHATIKTSDEFNNLRSAK